MKVDYPSVFLPHSGSGRVTFNNSKSFMKAVSAAFVEIKTAKFTKKVKYGRIDSIKGELNPNQN